MMNNVNLMGRLVHDPELRRTGDGASVTDVRIAVDRDFGTKGEEKKTDFIDVTAWRDEAEMIAKHFKKGDTIGINGRIQSDNWVDGKGNKRFSMSVVVNPRGVYFAGKRNVAAKTPTADAPAAEGDFDIVASDDATPAVLPF